MKSRALAPSSALVAPRLVLAGIRQLLAASAWRSKRTWSTCAIVFTPERRAVVSRAQLARELREGGLTDAAHEALARRVGPGEVLVYLVHDDDEGAGAGFLVVRMAVR